MQNYLFMIEKQLRQFISTSINREFARKVSHDRIILSTRSSHTINIYLYPDTICVDFAYECKAFDISNTSKFLHTLEIIGTLINELMTGALVYERVYYGSTQALCRVILINKITKRKVNLRSTALTSSYPHDAPRLVLREKLFFN